MELDQFIFQSLINAFRNNSLSHCRPFFLIVYFVPSKNVFSTENERRGQEGGRGTSMCLIDAPVSCDFDLEHFMK